MSDPRKGYYTVSVILNNGLMGAPSLHLTLGVNAVTGQITGHGDITQALAPPFGELFIPYVTGQIEYVGFGDAGMLVSLEGRYAIPFGPPPLIGHINALLRAAFVVDSEWNGEGSFSDGVRAEHRVPDCKVRKVTPQRDAPVNAGETATV